MKKALFIIAALASCMTVSAKYWFGGSIGFDTESRPSFSPDQPHYGTSLLQLSGHSRAFLFRVKKLGMPYKLRNLLATPKIVKVGAAVADDIRGLQRLGGFDARSFVDLQKMVWEYGIKDKSVKKMAAIINTGASRNMIDMAQSAKNIPARSPPSILLSRLSTGVVTLTL